MPRQAEDSRASNQAEDSEGRNLFGRFLRPRFLSQFWSIAAGLALGVLGLLPIALRHGWGGQTYVAFAEHFVYLHQLLQAGWGAGPSIAGPADTLSFQLGLMACGLTVLGLALPNRAATASQETEPPTIAPPASRLTFDVSRFTSHFALAAVLIPVLLSATLAAPLWRLLPFLQGTLIYPWQLLLLAGPWLAWLGGLGGKALFDRLPADSQAITGPLLFAVLLTLTLLASYSYLNPAATAVPAPDSGTPLVIFGENEIALLDAQVTILPQPSTTVSVTVHWQALRPLERDYTVFLHAVDPNGQLQGQQDTMPQGNKLPTTRWRPGQIVADQYYTALKPGAPPIEGYRFDLGLYLWQTGERLRTRTDDKVMVKP
jgi:hypothetical protein